MAPAWSSSGSSTPAALLEIHGVVECLVHAVVDDAEDPSGRDDELGACGVEQGVLDDGGRGGDNGVKLPAPASALS